MAVKWSGLITALQSKEKYPVVMSERVAAYYQHQYKLHVEIEAAPARERFVARGNVWRCEGSTCASPRSQTRPAIACAALAREAGRLTSFSVAEPRSTPKSWKTATAARADPNFCVATQPCRTTWWSGVEAV
jgi:hypothetical protein